MIDVVTIQNAHLYGDALASQHRLRHRIFIEREGYDVPSWNGMEYDQFDTPAAIYLIRRDPAGEARAVMRLIPTTVPYMIGSLWPHLIDQQAPSSPLVWEFSRVGCDVADPQLRDRYMGELIAGGLELGLLNGVREFICVTSPGILRRVVMRAGCDVEQMGRPTTIGRFPVVAGRVPITETALARVRRNKGLIGSVLNIVAPAPARRAA